MQAFDLRKARRWDPRQVSPLIVDTNRFNRNLLAEIMRTIGVMGLEIARDKEDAMRILSETRNISIVMVEWSDLNEMDALEFVRSVRGLSDDYTRRLPIIAASSSFNKEMLIEGRNAGVDEFLKKPCSPNDVIGRLRMVVETPRPFVDCKAYVGPCRRRKNPADYHGPRRRSADDMTDAKQISVAEQEMFDKDSPIGAAITRLKVCCSLLLSDRNTGLPRTQQAIVAAKEVAEDATDAALIKGLSAFDSYINWVAEGHAVDKRVIRTGINTMEQIIVLPEEYSTARETIATAFQDALHRKTTSSKAA